MIVKTIIALHCILASYLAFSSETKISKQLASDLSNKKIVELYILLNNKNKVYTLKSNNRINRLKNTIVQLKANAQSSQNQIMPLVSSLTKEYKFYWINNSMWIKLESHKARALIQSNHIRKAYSNTQYKLDIVKQTRAIKAPKATAWNLNLINAPQVWAQGFKGQNVIIAGQDTGYQWNHPALINKYMGWNGTTVDHNYSWHDAITNPNNTCLDAFNNPATCDDHGHGTHTMGTMLGDDSLGNQIGVAPDAKWIGCRNMDHGAGTPTTYTECFQFFMEPTDLNNQNPDPSKAPHIINNSWGCPGFEGCTQPDILESVVSSVVDAGILVVAAAGNTGPGCGSINTPIAIYSKTLSIGATDSSDLIASFSSRGSVSIDGSNRLKPDMSAPGKSIRSAYPTNSYNTLQGTSMASPHVAGVAALIISANPMLAGRPNTIAQILKFTSIPKYSVQNCGGVSGSQSPNNTFGWGRLDALAAVERAKDYLFLNSFEGN